MSAQLPPDPILTTYQYWNWLNVDEATRRQRALDNNYMTFPTVQNYPTFFSKLFLVTDVALTKMANTSYVYDKINDLLFGSNSWAGLNTFGSIDTNSITTNTITATTLALSGTQLDTPMTSTRTYPIIPFTLADGTTTYGTVGRIGYTIVRARTGGVYAQNGWKTLSTINITQGLWLITGEVRSSGVNGQSTGIAFNITTDTIVGAFGIRGPLRCEFGPPTDPPAEVSSSAIYYASGAVTMCLLMAAGPSGLTPDKSYLTAIRIA